MVYVITANYFFKYLYVKKYHPKEFVVYLTMKFNLICQHLTLHGISTLTLLPGLLYMNLMFDSSGPH